MFSTDGALKTTIPINAGNNAKDRKPHIGKIQRFELKEERKQRGVVVGEEARQGKEKHKTKKTIKCFLPPNEGN